MVERGAVAPAPRLKPVTDSVITEARPSLDTVIVLMHSGGRAVRVVSILFLIDQNFIK